MITMEKRVNYLDGVMAELAHAQLRTEMAMRELSRKDKELRAATIAMENSSREQAQRLEEIDRSLAATIAEMTEDTRRMKEDTRRMNKAWGDLANKMGTVAEDIVAPSIRRMATADFGLAEIEDMVVRGRRTSRRGERRRTEYDIVCAGQDRVIVVEVKATLTRQEIRLTPPRIAGFFDFYPEYEGRDLIGVLASWSIDDDLLPAISEAGLYGIAMGEQTLMIVTRPSVH